MTPQIIYLNGPSSSGKTTLAKALQETLPEPFLHIGIDKIIGMMPEKLNNWMGEPAPLGFSWKEARDREGHLIQELQIGEFAKKITHAYREMAKLLAQLGHNLIIDDVAFGAEEMDCWKELLKPFCVLYVGVFVPLEVLEQREKERGNRILGSARAQFYKVHSGDGCSDNCYDLKIDTFQMNTTQCVEEICRKLSIFSTSAPRL